MLFIWYPKCTTCQKAKAWLDTHGLFYELREIKTQTSGLQYKALGLKDKQPTMSEEEQFSLLASDGMLVKRPILVGTDHAFFGFKEADWAEKLLK